MSFTIVESKLKNVFLGEHRYYLNNSNTKYVSISLSVDHNYMPVIAISGCKNDCVVFNEKQWCEFLSFKQNIDIFLNNGPPHDDPIDATQFNIEFKEFQQSRALKICTGDSCVFLGAKSVESLWRYIPIIQGRLEILKKQEFTNSLKILQAGVRGVVDISSSAMQVLEPIKHINSEMYSIFLEIVYKFPELLKDDVEA
uniref:Uncharacterized protein LOC114336799 isoform X1 n=1 Tax=Diabrotica virgifera virgifera TaxID=50390 RepID=A0A6P7G1Z4_DIAVI